MELFAGDSSLHFVAFGMTPHLIGAEGVGSSGFAAASYSPLTL